MDPAAERRRRVERSPQRWAADVAAAVPDVLPRRDVTRRPGDGPGAGVRLLDVRGSVEAGRPVLHVTYRHPWWSWTTGLRRWLDTDDHPWPGGDADPARQLAAALVLTDVGEPLGTVADDLVPDRDGTWWWGDDPLPGDHDRRGRPPAGS